MPQNLKNFQDHHTRLYIGPTDADQLDLFTVKAKLVEEDLDLVEAFGK